MKKIIILMTTLILFCISCTTVEKTNTNMEITDSTWKLEKILNEKIEMNNITLSFITKDKKISGKSAVNNYFGGYESNENKIKINVVGLTRMAGPEKEMNLEQKYIETLAQMEKIEIKNNKMILEGNNKKLEFSKIK